MTPPAVPQNARQALLDAAKRIMAHTGFRAVGLNEVLSQAGVPKGSFYHYFSSKDAFGEALMQDYFLSYLANMDSIFADPAAPAAERLLRYFEEFRERQSADDFQSGCLVVTLGPEAANFAGPMRGELNSGVSQIIDRLERIITQVSPMSRCRRRTRDRPPRSCTTCGSAPASWLRSTATRRRSTPR